MTSKQFDNQQPIGIIGAMDQEVALLREQMQGMPANVSGRCAVFHRYAELHSGRVAAMRYWQS